MSFERDLKQLITNIVKEETRWLRHYSAQVVDNEDILQKGRVKVIIPDLGFDTPEQGMWCFPRQGNSLSVPLIDEWVEIYFMRGDPNEPRYLYYASESMEVSPNYTGIKDRVIFESPETGEFIKYNDEEKKITVQTTEAEITIDADSNVTVGGDVNLDVSGTINVTGATAINLLGATEAFLNGTTFDSWLSTTLKTIFDAHVHPGVTSGGASTAPTVTPLTLPSGHLSTKIKGE